MNRELMPYFRTEAFPTPFCPGCGHGILMVALVRAIHDLAIPRERLLFVSGIGCAGWIPSPHYRADTLHVTHGRPIAFATGARAVRPDLTIVVISGDGDLASIGGNHLIHGARRDLEMTVICADNQVYGMTGGQVAPTTPVGARSSTTPSGNTERPFDLCRLVASAGATYVARSTVYHWKALHRILTRALTHKGFSFVDVISPCFTHFGRANGYATPGEMILDLHRRGARAERPEDLYREPREGTFFLGEFVAPQPDS